MYACVVTNLEVAQATPLRPVAEVAAAAGLRPDDFETLGKYKAKLTADGMARLTATRKGKTVLVTAVTPTLHGEGKTTVTVGLAQALNKHGLAVPAIREPALGPVFGVKGGACGGGYSQVLPMEDINLFFTGDFPAITAAHNLLSALVDAHIHNGNTLGLDPRVVKWPRAVDMNDRALRAIVTGLGGTSNGPVREGGFVITPASEVMAVLCLSRNLAELKANLGRIIVGDGPKGVPVTAADIGAHGAMTVLLRDALRPNLVQTVEGGLAFVHGGPFANIAHGCSTLVATQCALGLADFVVTEAGFASDLGAEKFMDLVAPRLGHGPDAVVLVASVRALAHHGGDDLEVGCQNLFRHSQHLSHYGVPIVVAVNRFAGDTDADHATIHRLCAQRGLTSVSCNPFLGGGEGCRDLADSVATECRASSTWTPLYSAHQTIPEKLESVVTQAHGGQGVVLESAAKKDLAWIEKHGFGQLSVCVAKTQYSLSDDPTLLNAPTGFDLHVRRLRVSAGAGFVVAECGDIMLMPGLGKKPAALTIDLDEQGRLTGMF